MVAFSSNTLRQKQYGVKLIWSLTHEYSAAWVLGDSHCKSKTLV